MAEETDFAQQTRQINVIDDIKITEERRIICYNQLIYDNPYLEPDEYAGLTLGVIDDNEEDQATANTTSGKNHFHEMNGDVGMAGWK